MILLKPIIIEEGLDLTQTYKPRKTVRAIIMNGEHKILLAYSSLFQDYTFPGGGVKTTESEMTALKRELKEEIGAEKIEIIKPLLKTQELKYGLNENGHIYLQTSIYYIVKVHLFGTQELIGREINHGITPKWITLDQAILHNETIKNDENHQKRGLKTVLTRENRVLTYLKENKINA